MSASAGPDRAVRVRLHRAPLAPAAAALAGGVLAGRYLFLPLRFWAILVAAGVAAGVVGLCRPRWRAIARAGVAAAILAAGAAHFQLTHFALPRDAVVTFTDEAPILATLRGRIATAPQRVRPRAEAFGYQPARTTFLLDATAIQTDAGFRPAAGLVRVTVQELAPHLAAGQSVELLGRIGRYGRPRNPGEDDRRRWGRLRGTMVWMSVPTADAVIVRAGAEPPWHRRALWNLRAGARQHLAGPHEAPGRHLLAALVLGERHPALRSLSRTMVRAGTAHLLSISGLHLGIFLGVVFLTCRLLLLTPRRAAVVVLVVLAAYLLLAEPRAPLLRSAIMAAALCTGLLRGRRYMPLNALAAAAIILLVLDPRQLFQAGFQLSFVIVTALVLFLGPARRVLFGRWLRRRGLLVFRGRDRVRRWLYYAVGDAATYAVTAALLAYAAAAPLVAYHFGLFNPYAPLLSLLLLPLVVAVVVPGYVAMALAWPMPNLSYQFGRAGRSAAALLERVVEAIGKLPALSVGLRPIHWAWVWLCFAVFVLVALRRRVPFGRAAAGAGLVLLAGATAWTQRPTPRRAGAELHLLDVGSGQCAVLRTPAGCTFLLDAGGPGGNVHRRTLGPFLRHMRFAPPRAVLLSHANSDHYNAVPALLAETRPRRVYVSEVFARRWDDGAGAYELMDRLAADGVEVVRLRAGRSVDLGPETRVEVLWPPAKPAEPLSLNDTSLVLRVTCGGQSVLLAGDLDRTGQAALAARPGALRADILVLPHHGGWEPTLPAFVEAVAPTTVLVSTSRLLRGPADEPQATAFYQRLRERADVYSTRERGWIGVTFGAGPVRVKTMR